MYSALVDQLKRHGIGYTSKILRTLAADYILANKQEFSPFIDGPEPFEVYCQNINNPAVWGSQLELQALSHVLKSPIYVYSADGPIAKMGESYSGDPLLLSFHKHEYTMGEHYNSVVPYEKDESEQ